MSGLTRRKVTVKGKRGTYQRSVMVKAGEKMRRFLGAHKKKIAVAGAVALAGGLAYAHHRAGVKQAWDRVKEKQARVDTEFRVKRETDAWVKRNEGRWAASWAIRTAKREASKPKRFRELGAGR
jgi:hypothetical protein